ncbi:MAG TPA: hypothetical protein VF941_06325 [Clostridia bacterium]
MREINKKIESGAALTDQELLKAIKFFNDLEDKLSQLGIKYSITRSYITQILYSLEMFKRFRGIK